MYLVKDITLHFQLVAQILPICVGLRYYLTKLGGLKNNTNATNYHRLNKKLRKLLQSNCTKLQDN